MPLQGAPVLQPAVPVVAAVVTRRQFDVAAGQVPRLRFEDDVTGVRVPALTDGELIHVLVPRMVLALDRWKRLTERADQRPAPSRRDKSVPTRPPEPPC